MKINIKEIKKAQAVDYNFCQVCGETDPKDGFYPLFMGTLDSISMLMCNKCENEARNIYK